MGEVSPLIISEAKRLGETSEAALESYHEDAFNPCHYFNINVTCQLKVWSKVKRNTSFTFGTLGRAAQIRLLGYNVSFRNAVERTTYKTELG